MFHIECVYIRGCVCVLSFFATGISDFHPGAITRLRANIFFANVKSPIAEYFNVGELFLSKKFQMFLRE